MNPLKWLESAFSAVKSLPGLVGLKAANEALIVRNQLLEHEKNRAEADLVSALRDLKETQDLLTAKEQQAQALQSRIDKFDQLSQREVRILHLLSGYSCLTTDDIANMLGEERAHIAHTLQLLSRNRFVDDRSGFGEKSCWGLDSNGLTYVFRPSPKLPENSLTDPPPSAGDSLER